MSVSPWFPARQAQRSGCRDPPRSAGPWRHWIRPPQNTLQHQTYELSGSSDGERISLLSQCTCEHNTENHFQLIFNLLKCFCFCKCWTNRLTPTHLSSDMSSSWPSFIHITWIFGSETSHSKIAFFFSVIFMSLIFLVNSITRAENKKNDV